MSGSFAVKYFERSDWECGDLDVYVAEGRQQELLRFITAQGYLWVSTREVDSHDEYTMKGITTVSTWTSCDSII